MTQVACDGQAGPGRAPERPRVRGRGSDDAAAFQPTLGVGHLMRLVVASLRQQTDQALAPRKLTHAQWVPLFKLSLRGIATVAELALACELDAGAMTRTLDRLERKGLVCRQRSVADRRVVHVALTAQGRAVAADIPQVLCEVLNAHLQGFSEAEWRMLEGLLGRMLANGQALQVRAGGARSGGTAASA